MVYIPLNLDRLRAGTTVLRDLLRFATTTFSLITTNKF